MPTPFWEDLDAFLDLDDFAVPAVIQLQGGGQVSLAVIFDNPYVEGDLGDASTRDEVRPVATCKEALVGAVRRGDTITIQFPRGPRTFDILTAPQPDGTGTSRIVLARP